MLTPALLVLHAGHPPAPHDLWTSWSWEPAVLAGLALGGGLYARGLRALRRRAGPGRVVPRWRVGCYAAGLAALFLALVSPVDQVATALFSVHMLQHLLLVLVAAPLLLLGNPGLVVLWALPSGARRGLARWWRRSRRLRALWRGLTAPAVAWTIHTAALWLWHVPGPYEAALRSEAVHALEHACFFGTALLFWWVLVRPRPLPFGADLVYVFLAAMQSGVLGALITFATRVWYPIHAAYTLPWGLTPLEDQQLAGLVMWVPGGVAYLAALAALFLVGFRRLDGRRSRPLLPALAGAPAPRRGTAG